MDKLSEVYNIFENFSKEHHLKFDLYDNQFSNENMQNSPTEGLYISSEQIGNTVRGTLYLGFSRQKRVPEVFKHFLLLPKQNFVYTSSRVIPVDGFNVGQIDFIYC